MYLDERSKCRWSNSRCEPLLCLLLCLWSVGEAWRGREGGGEEWPFSEGRPIGSLKEPFGVNSTHTRLNRSEFFLGSGFLWPLACEAAAFVSPSLSISNEGQL